MGGFVLPRNPWTLFAARYGIKCKQEPLAFSGLFQFSSSQLVDIIDLTSDKRIKNDIFSLRTMWIDNSGLTAGSGPPVLTAFTIQNSGQVIAVKPNTQGFYPVIAQDLESGAMLKILGSAPTAGATLVSIPVMFLNFDIVPWVTTTALGPGGLKTFVQQGSGSSSVSASSVSINPGLTNFTNGNSLLLTIGLNAAGVTVSSITGTGTSLWQQVGSVNTGAHDTEIWLGRVGAGAGLSLTANFSGATTSNFMLSEWNGIATISPIDGSVASNNSILTSSPSTAPYSTSVSNDLMYTVLREDSITNETAEPAGYTVFDAGTGNTVAVRGGYLIGGTLGAQTATWLFAAAHTFDTMIIGFR